MSELAGARVLLTGGGGFLGRHVGDALHARGAEVLVVRSADCDLRDRSSTLALLAGVRPDYVVHAAAVGGGIGWMRAHPATAYAGNVLMNTCVVEAAARVKVRRLVGVSSACAYAVDARQPMREEDLQVGQPEPTNGPYGLAKRMMLVHGAACAQESGLDCAFVVPTNLYGPGEDVSPERAHVVGALIRRFEDARRAGAEAVTCWGTGRATRDLLFVRDAAEGIVRALEVGGGPDPVNLGSGDERTVAEIAGAVASAVGFEGHIDWDASKPDGMPRKVLDTTRARTRLGWAARTPLEEGLLETVEWFRSCS